MSLFEEEAAVSGDDEVSDDEDDESDSSSVSSSSSSSTSSSSSSSSDSDGKRKKKRSSRSRKKFRKGSKKLKKKKKRKKSSKKPSKPRKRQKQEESTSVLPAIAEGDEKHAQGALTTAKPPSPVASIPEEMLNDSSGPKRNDDPDDFPDDFSTEEALASELQEEASRMGLEDEEDATPPPPPPNPLQSIDTFKSMYNQVAEMLGVPETFTDEVEWRKQHALFRKAVKETRASVPESRAPDVAVYVHCICWRVADLNGFSDGSKWETKVQHSNLYSTGQLPIYKPKDKRQNDEAQKRRIEAIEELKMDAFDIDDVVCAPPPSRSNQAGNGLRMIDLLRRYKIERLADVLAYAEGTAFNLYVKNRKKQPRRAMNDNVEYETFVYNQEDRALLDAALFRTLITLAGNVQALGVTDLVPTLEDGTANGVAPVQAHVPQPPPQARAPPVVQEVGTSRRSVSSFSEGSNTSPRSTRVSAVAPGFNMPQSMSSHSLPSQRSGSPPPANTQLQPDPPGRVRIGTVITESGIELAIRNQTESDITFKFLKELRMQTGGKMIQMDKQRGFVRPKDGPYYVYTETDRESIKDCALVALQDLNRLYGTNVSLI